MANRKAITILIILTSLFMEPLMVTGQEALKDPIWRPTPPKFPAKSGDLIIRHKGKTLGPIGGIPHIGVYTGNTTTDGISYDVIDLGIKNGKGVIRSSHWTDESRFKDPGFYSLLDSQIPVRHNGEITTLSALPEALCANISETLPNL